MHKEEMTRSEKNRKANVSYVISNDISNEIQENLWSPLLFSGHARISDYAFRARHGFTVRLSFPGIDPRKPHPFAGSSTGFSFGRRLLGKFLDHRKTIVFEGECILLWWGDDSRKGKRADFALDCDVKQNHPMAGYHAGQSDGDVLMVQFKDSPDSQPVSPNEQTRRRRLLALACQLPRQESFQAWFLENIARKIDNTYNQLKKDNSKDMSGDISEYMPEYVAECLRRYCGISSRRELLDDGLVAEKARGRLQGLVAEFRHQSMNFGYL